MSSPQETGEQPVIELRGVTRVFGAHVAVRAVDLTVRPREFLVILGESGSGKTTLLKMINRLQTPDSGDVLIHGESTRAAVEHELRRRIGYVFQRVGLFPHMTVAENIAVTPRLLGWDEANVIVRHVFERADGVVTTEGFTVSRFISTKGERIATARVVEALKIGNAPSGLTANAAAALLRAKEGYGLKMA